MNAPRAPNAIEHIVIFGGGSAGWMSAAALSRFAERSGVRITLIESDEIGIVGVGEATIPPINQFNALIGIDENEFVAATRGSYKLGIEFVDWRRKGDRYLHPFGRYGADIEAVNFHQVWFRHRAGGGASALDEYCLNAVAARKGRVARPSGDPRSVLSSFAYAFHFDASLYARFLRRIAEARGVLRIEGKVARALRNAQTGFVIGLAMDDGRVIEGDLFIDCSGFRSALLGGELGVGYEDWSHWLPCDRAVAMPCDRVSPIIPYTRATALEAGWRWRIPLQHRTGNGYVYCSAQISDDAAAAALRSELDAPASGEPRFLRFTAGRRRRFWEKNVVAIGLAGGFLEPLESTSIHLIQAGVSKLIALFPDKRFDPVLAAEYNRLTAMQFEQVRDFIILHYKAVERGETLWRAAAAMPVPETLERKMALFRESGRIFRFEDELFGESNWLAVMLGQGVTPRRYDPMADALPFDAVERHLAAMRSAIAAATDAMPTHEDFLAANRPAGRPAEKGRRQ